MTSAAAWARACRLRRELDRATIYAHGFIDADLTRSERRALSKLNQSIDESRELVMHLQFSLAERTRLAGTKDPDYSEVGK